MKIKSIKKQAASATHYDLQIGKNHNFFANDILTHNCNFPARRVAVVGVERGLSEVDPLDVIQECGRAGRPRYDKEGDAYILVEDKKLSRWEQYFINGVEVKSRLFTKIGFHLIGEIAEKRIKNEDEGELWGKRTLSAYQKLWDPLSIGVGSVGNIFNVYAANNLIERNGNGYAATKLGVIASKNYYDPMDVVAWKKNLQVIRERQFEKDDAAVAWAIAAKPSAMTGYMPKDMQLLATRYLELLRAKNLYTSSDGATALATVIYNHLQGETALLDPWTAIRTSFILDCERIISCLSQIDSRVLSCRGTEYWNLLLLRMLYGVNWKQAELCQLKGIGRVHSEKLYFAGIESIDGFLKKKETAREVLPEAVYFTAMKSAREILKKESTW